jgi:hypothetical protein
LITSADSATVGASVNLDGSASTVATGRTIVAYAWTSDPAVGIENASSAKARFVMPGLRPVTITLTITDDLGHTASAQKTIYTGLLPAGRSGGGAFPAWALALLGAVLLARQRGPWLARRRAPVQPPGSDWN